MGGSVGRVPAALALSVSDLGASAALVAGTCWARVGDEGRNARMQVARIRSRMRDLQFEIAFDPRFEKVMARSSWAKPLYPRDGR
jgi:hypothetical protein